MLLPKVVGAVAVIESDVNITTPDGRADCYFVHPASGAAAAVLVWPDIFGLRRAFWQMGKYRAKKAPTAAGWRRTSRTARIFKRRKRTRSFSSRSPHIAVSAPLAGRRR
jgi:dienelactone hydrolase